MWQPKKQIKHVELIAEYLRFTGTVAEVLFSVTKKLKLSLMHWIVTVQSVFEPFTPARCNSATIERNY
jgi:hypothetical protein